MKHKVIRMMAYLYMPFLFSLLGYGMIYIVLAPGIEMLKATINMAITNETPDFNQELKTIYNPILKKGTMIPQENNIPANSTEVIDAHNQPVVDTLGDIVDIRSIQFPNLGTHFAEISCERIGLEAPLYWGDTKEILREGVGQFMGSFLPGFERSILLSGHNTTCFNALQFIEVGDVVLCQTNYGEFEYNVTKISVMKVKNAEDLLDEMLSFQEEQLIMYTCYPFETLAGNKQERLFVFAEKISGPKVE